MPGPVDPPPSGGEPSPLWPRLPDRTQGGKAGGSATMDAGSATMEAGLATTNAGFSATEGNEGKFSGLRSRFPAQYIKRFVHYPQWTTGDPQ